MRFKKHADLIIQQALEDLFPLTDDADPEHLTAVLRAYYGALTAIGARP